MTPQEIEALPYRLNVGVMLVNQAGGVFVGQRLDSPTDAWQMPQGGIDEGEDPTEAALRELEEETSIKNVELITELDGFITYNLPDHLLGVIWRGK